MPVSVTAVSVPGPVLVSVTDCPGPRFRPPESRGITVICERLLPSAGKFVGEAVTVVVVALTVPTAAVAVAVNNTVWAVSPAARTSTL